MSGKSLVFIAPNAAAVGEGGSVCHLVVEAVGIATASEEAL